MYYLFYHDAILGIVTLLRNNWGQVYECEELILEPSKVVQVVHILFICKRSY